MESNLYAVVMAGGQGTRFWPESVSKKPKQYLNLVGDSSLLSQSLNRFETLVGNEQRYIVTVKQQENLVKENSQNLISKNGLIFEPSGRNTAPCILLAMAHLLANGASENDVCAIVPSDHVILNESGFRDVIKDAHLYASREDKIVTIGIPPTFPHTGYGYIHRGTEIDSNVYNVTEFKEKPNFDKAKEYLATGEYYWNAGMFVASIKTLTKEFKEHAPEIFEHFEALRENIDNFDGLSSVYNKIPSDSIDFAIMEKSENVLVLPARFDWNDLGSWDALEEVITKTNGNTIASAKSSYIVEAQGNIVFAPDKFVSLIGVNDLIVVSNERALMVLPKNQAQKVKDIVGHLKETQPELL